MASLSPDLFHRAPRGAQPVTPHHYQPPTPRELRAQAVHRLQIGILGLASMMLLVGLANIIMDHARGNGLADSVQAQPTATSLPDDPENAGRDPLADIGVVPDLPATKAVGSAPASSAGPSSAR
jgi:hypothetical protein